MVTEANIVEHLYLDIPKFHWGGNHTFHIALAVAKFLERSLSPGMRTLETGAGLSTILFAMKRCQHICVTPSEDEVARIHEYLKSNGIPSEQLTFVVGKSQDILPTLKLEALDVVLVDGQHAFPVPFIDWYFTQRWLRVGGTLVVDDTQLWTGRVLRDFLLEESEWELLQDFFGRAACFRKVKETADPRWWGMQSYVVRKSRFGQYAERIRRSLCLLCGRIEKKHNAKAPMSKEALRYKE